MDLLDFLRKIQFLSQLVSKHQPDASMESQLDLLFAKRVLSALELGNKMEIGLCFLCDKPFTVEHQSAHKNVRFVVMENEEEEPEQEKEPNHSLTRVSEMDSTIIDGSMVGTRKHEGEGQQPKLGLSFAAPTSVAAKHSVTSDSSSFFFDPKMSSDDETEDSQSEDIPAGDPASEHLFFAPTEIDEAEMTKTTQSHKLLTEGTNFPAITDSVSVVTNQLKKTTSEIFKESTPPPPPLNPLTLDPTTEADWYSTETELIFSHDMTVCPLPKPRNTSHSAFTKLEGPLKMRMKLAPICVARMSWFLVRKLREADLEMDWEKLKRALLDGSLVHIPIDFLNFKFSLDGILKFLPPILRFVLSDKSKLMTIGLNTSHRDYKIVAPVFFTLVAGNVGFFPLWNVGLMVVEHQVQIQMPRPSTIQEAPAVIKSFYDKRIVGCPGGEGEDEQDVVWFWLEKGKPHECPVCAQYFVVPSSWRSLEHIRLLGLAATRDLSPGSRVESFSLCPLEFI